VPRLVEHSPNLDILKIIKEMKQHQTGGTEPPILDIDVRQICVMHLLDEGMQKIEIASLLDVSRGNDLQR